MGKSQANRANFSMTKRELIAALRKLRQENRLSQDALAMSIGKCRETIVAYENGYPDYSPDVDVIEMWAEILGHELVLQPRKRT
jgi:transcriptional regulator with XRE-family HTH domain